MRQSFTAFLRSFKQKNATAVPKISYVGGKLVKYTDGAGSGSTSLTDLTGGISSAAAAGDLIIVTLVNSSNSTRLVSMTVTTSGYADVNSGFANSTYDANIKMLYKLMGPTPDTSVAYTMTNSSSDVIGAFIQVFRGVDQVTPFSGVSSVVASQTNSADPNPGSITSNTKNSIVLVASTVATGASVTAPISQSYLTNAISDTWIRNGSLFWSISSIVGYVERDATLYDPATMTTDASDTGTSWVSITAVIKPG